MNDNDSRPDKGKRRDPSETTPLLPSTSELTVPDLAQPTRRKILVRVFLVSLAVCVLAVAAFGWLVSSYAAHARRMSPDDFIRDALVLHAPFNVSISNSTSADQVLLDISFRAGIDAGSVIGLDHSLWSSIGRWAIKQLDSIFVDLSSVHITHHSNLLTSLLFQPFVIPLAANPSHSDFSWLRAISTSVRVDLPSNISLIQHFVQDSWKHRVFSVTAALDKVMVSGSSGWNKAFHTSLTRMITDVNFTGLYFCWGLGCCSCCLAPSLPGLPSPGGDLPPLLDLVTLRSFEVNVRANILSLQVVATLVDPAPLDLQLTAPSLPFVVSLPFLSSSIPIASVESGPFSLTHPNITLDITGHVLPLSTEAIGPLSMFLSNYMSALPNPIVISSPRFHGISIDATFPAPYPRPHILQNVTIHNMKIKPGNVFLASGTVFARLVLPKGIHIGLDVQRVLPDVLIFDGEVEDQYHETIFPDPLPARAFGHIKPNDWVDSDCQPEENGEEFVFTLSAKIVDVPLKVLPGREKQFSNFVSKVNVITYLSLWVSS